MEFHGRNLSSLKWDLIGHRTLSKPQIVYSKFLIFKSAFITMFNVSDNLNVWNNVFLFLFFLSFFLNVFFSLVGCVDNLTLFALGNFLV